MLQGALMSCRSATLCAPTILCLLAFLTRPAAHGEVRSPATLSMNRLPVAASRQSAAGWLLPRTAALCRDAATPRVMASADFSQRLARTNLLIYLNAKG